MFFSRWFRPRPARRTFRPTFCVLEDRNVPSRFGHDFVLHDRQGPSERLQTRVVNDVQAAVAFQVITEDEARAGQPAGVTVIALDLSGHRVKDYAGTVTLTSSDKTAVLPAKYTFTPADEGRHTFQVVFNAAGQQTVTATDTNNPSLIGQATVLVEAAVVVPVTPAGVVTHFGIIAEDEAAAGSPLIFQVVALDASNKVVTGYTGTVHFTSNDTSAVLPNDYTFVAADQGVHVFSVTFNKLDTQSIKVSDTANTALTGLRDIQVVAQLADDDDLDLGDHGGHGGSGHRGRG
jgi:hypothetical protein